ncbi:hypothetical protein UVI_02037270 [Ustilaginoidea virens]|uniref:Uncharacterized protein n=1 Tax=Ustilaginoidea virens TaxID=1159556 RepID=A0A1B5L451_USTVR|nr:hypothetical protein UVI_02037270 [Ustilaginoidea virens]
MDMDVETRNSIALHTRSMESPVTRARLCIRGRQPAVGCTLIPGTGHLHQNASRNAYLVPALDAVNLTPQRRGLRPAIAALPKLRHQGRSSRGTASLRNTLALDLGHGGGESPGSHARWLGSVPPGMALVWMPGNGRVRQAVLPIGAQGTALAALKAYRQAALLALLQDPATWPATQVASGYAFEDGFPAFVGSFEPEIFVKPRDLGEMLRLCLIRHVSWSVEDGGVWAFIIIDWAAVL